MPASQKSTMNKVKETARETAASAAHKAQEKVQANTEAVRDQTADETKKVADAAHAAADEFDTGSLQAQAIEQVATRVDDLAAQIRNTDIDRLARTVGDAARRNPVLFVAGAALVGFAATRFLKSRSPDQNARSEFDDPWAVDATQDMSGSDVSAMPHRKA
ncbi:MAG: hypothetical protein AAGK79_02365 [Pseudomonadota bacterium]